MSVVDPPVAVGPARWLGGPSDFGLLLPDASPTPSTMYAPRGVCLTDDAVIVADTGNHRILIWHDGIDGPDHGPADVVLGQPDATSEGPKLFFLPTGLAVIDGRLVVCDAWHHRLLVWDTVPTRGDEAHSIVLGQPDLGGVTEGCGPQQFYWPFGCALVDGTFWVTDTGNRRVLGWRGGIPEPGQGADVVLGQVDLDHRGENRDGPVAANSLRWPHAVCGVGDLLIVADAGNHRILGWRGPMAAERAADVVMGQGAFTTAAEFPYRPQGPRALRFPYAVAASPSGALFVADTSNNRIAIIDDAGATLAAEPVGAPFDRVLGQRDLDANGENRWSRVEHDSLCWPYGLAYHDRALAVADSGNNRVMLWRVDR
jgi:hypothetical protein